MEFRDQLLVLRRSWLLGLLTAALVLGATAAWTFTQTPKYTATAEAWVSTRGSGSVQDLNAGGAYAQQVVKGYAQVATRPIVLDRVRSQLDLPYSLERLTQAVSAGVAADTPVLQVEVTDPSATRAADIANAVVDNLSAVVGTLDHSSAAEAEVTVTRITPATAADVSASPRIVLNLVLGLLIGLAAAIGVAYIRSALDIRIRNVADVTTVTGLPLLGSVGLATGAAKHQGPHPGRAGSPMTEAFKLLRTNLQYLDLRGQSRVVTVTSAVQSEGKSTTVAGLGSVIAEVESCVVVDADLRKPRLADYFGLDGSIGLTDVLVGAVSLDDALQTWGEHGLHVLPAGRIPPNPSELLQSEAMTRLIAELSARYSTVVFDAPPLLPVTDATLLSKATGGAVVVAASGRVTKAQLRGGVHALGQVQARILGVVLTMVPNRGPDSTGYSRYYGEKRAQRTRTAPRRPVGDPETA